jgi:hypothetical protein
MSSITLSEAEIEAITGYVQPAAQLAELLRRGFDRARRSSRTGMVIVERAHYDAVCAGTRLARAPEIRPRLVKTTPHRPTLRTV